MELLITHTLLCFGQLISIVDPFAAVPVFLALLGTQPRRVQSVVALRASMVCLCVLTAFAFVGSYILRFFSITLPAFKVAGGLILFAVALEMMRAHPSNTRTTPEEQHEAEQRSDIGILPLGIPLLAGPGGITNVMLLNGEAKSVIDHVAIYFAIMLVSLTAFLVLRSAGMMARILGQTGINIIGRIMGLILAAISTQFVIDGLRDALPFLQTLPTR